MITYIQSEGNASLLLTWRERKGEKQTVMVSHMSAIFVSRQSALHIAREVLDQRKLSFLDSPGLCHWLDPQALSEIHYISRALPLPVKAG